MAVLASIFFAIAVAFAEGHGECHNLHDARVLKVHGQDGVKNAIKDCYKDCGNVGDCDPKKADGCVKHKLSGKKGGGGVSHNCAHCFGEHIHCIFTKCFTDCPKDTSDKCKSCIKSHCEAALKHCTGLNPKSQVESTYLSSGSLAPTQHVDTESVIDHGHHNSSHHHNKSHSHHNTSHDHHNKSHHHHNKSHHHHHDHHNKSHHHHNASQLSVSKGNCHNIHDGLILKAHGKNSVKHHVWECADDLAKKEPKTDHEKREKLDKCINDKFHEAKGKNKGKLSKDCVGCFSDSVLCSEKHCLIECGHKGSKCDHCMKDKCEGGFDKCSHLKSAATAAASIFI